MTSEQTRQKDIRNWFHPITPLRLHEERGATVMRSGKGIYVTDIDGTTYLDAFAGLWCINVGYGEKRIVDAVKHQIETLCYSTGFFHLGSEPTIELAARVAELTPGDLNRIFFTNGGSDAVDSAIRMVRFYFNATGQTEKKHFISLERGYHGCTTIGAGLSGMALFHDGFDAPTTTQHHIPSHYVYRNPVGDDPAAVIAASVSALTEKVNEIGADKVAAFVCEPVQGSGGVIVPPPGWLKAMEEECRRLDVLFVVDEVITAFGRTGTMFACEHENVEPDLLTMAKGLTSGYLPMGAVAVSDRLYEVIADHGKDGTTFGMGYTYSGHPVAAAAGLAAIDLYLEGGVLENSQSVGPYFQERLQTLKYHPLVGDVRGKGLLGALELVVNKETKEKPQPVAEWSRTAFEIGLKKQIVFRAFGDACIGLAPPLVITPEEVDVLIERLTEVLDDLNT